MKNLQSIVVLVAICMAVTAMFATPASCEEKLPVQNPTLEQATARTAKLNELVATTTTETASATTDADKAVGRLRLNSYQVALGQGFVDIPLNTTPELCESIKAVLVTEIGTAKKDVDDAQTAAADDLAYVATVRLARYRSALASLNGCGGTRPSNGNSGSSSGKSSKKAANSEPSALDRYVDAQAARWKDQAAKDASQDEAISALAGRVTQLEDGQADVSELAGRVETTERQIHGTPRQSRLDRQAERAAAANSEAANRAAGWIKCKDAEGRTIWCSPQDVTKRCH